MELFLCEQTSDANASWRHSLRAVLEGRLSPSIRWIGSPLPNNVGLTFVYMEENCGCLDNCVSKVLIQVASTPDAGAETPQPLLCSRAGVARDLSP